MNRNELDGMGSDLASMQKELLKGVPLFIRVLWFCGMLGSLTVFALIVTLLVKVIGKL